MSFIKLNTHSGKESRQCLTLSNHIIGYITHGTLRIYYNNEVRNISQGTIFILCAGNHRVEYLTDNRHPYEEIVINLSPTILQSIVHNNPHFNMESSHHIYIPHAQLNTPYILSIYFQEIKNYIALKIFNRCELMELIKINELIHLILYQPTSHIAQSLLQIIGHNRIEFVTHIRASLYRNVTIKQLANECGMSLSNFKLIFQRLFNCPPHHWFISNRLRSVCTLLEYTYQPIKEIANECGFSSPSHMIRLFRNHYGTTPTQYRATHNHHYSILKNTTMLLK